MVSNIKDRVYRVVGTFFLASITLVFANHPTPQHILTTYIPYISRLNPSVLSNGSLFIAILTTLLVLFVSFIPLFKPKPRRILDTILVTQKRVFISGFILAAIGYFDYTYRLPRSTLLLFISMLLVLLPLWFVFVGRRPSMAPENILLVGNNEESMKDILENNRDLDFVGYISPFPLYQEKEVFDGGKLTIENREDLEWLGTFTRLTDIITKHNIDTVILAFGGSDRSDFFGVLDTCYEHGVNVKTHRVNGDSVLTSEGKIGSDELVDVELEPLDPQDYIIKRIFDVCFSGFGLLFLSPIILVIAIAIKLNSRGPIFYSQKRTAEFGDTFTVYKFRSMVPEGDSPEPVDDEENPRITHVGRFLRKTHFDEIPQLWSILTGKMSVVGPRAVWTEEEKLLEEKTNMWRKRWFIKPGLTGLAQIKDAKSTNPEKKLSYDLQYIRKQSFWFDIKIVIRQIWKVIGDVYKTIKGTK